MKPGTYVTHLESYHIRLHRWGDGRDELPAAVRQTQQHTVEAAGCSTWQLQADGAQRSAHRAAQAQAAAGFATIGGLWRQKTALRDAVVLPLRHPRLFAALGTQARHAR